MPGPFQSAGKARVTSRPTISRRNGGRRTMPKAKLKFYDVKAKKSFMSSNYKMVTKKGRRFAVAKAPSGIMAYRIVGMA